MKTDDYKQELRISATLRRTNAKKYFCIQKSASLDPLLFFYFEG
jgi:hypothetical protein